MSENKLLSPCPFCGGELSLDIDEEGGMAIYHGKKDEGCLCVFPSIVEIDMPVGTTLKQVIESINNRPIEDELRSEIARRDEELALTEKKLCNIDRSARAEVARRDEKLKITDGLLKEATETIGAVIACCTYNSNDDAKIGIYGIDQKAFTMIDQFITHYNDAVSAGKVSVDVKPVKRENDYQNDNRTNTGG